MIKDNPLSEGITVKVYKDYQKNQDYIGEAILISKVSDGLPYVIVDSFSEESQYTYTTERWYLQFISGAYKGVKQSRSVRYLLYEGLYTSPEDLEDIGEVEDRFDLLEELGECF